MTRITTLMPASEETAVPENVTVAIQEMGEQSRGNEEIYRWIQRRLHKRSERILRQFPRYASSVDPDQLISEFIIQLLGKIGAASVKNRDHFFGMSCMYFRWILMNMANRTTLQKSGEPDQQPGRSYDMEAFISLLDYIETELTEEEQQLINMRLILEFRWKNIETILQTPRATLSDRVQKLKKKMQDDLKIIWTDTDAD